MHTLYLYTMYMLVTLTKTYAISVLLVTLYTLLVLIWAPLFRRDTTLTTSPSSLAEISWSFYRHRITHSRHDTYTIASVPDLPRLQVYEKVYVHVGIWSAQTFRQSKILHAHILYSRIKWTAWNWDNIHYTLNIYSLPPSPSLSPLLPFTLHLSLSPSPSLSGKVKKCLPPHCKDKWELWQNY